MDIFPSKLSKLSNEITISTDISIDDNLDLELEYEFDNYYIELHKQLAEKISGISNAKVAVKILGSPVQKEHIDIYCPSILKSNTINANIKIQLSESINKTIKFYEKE